MQISVDVPHKILFSGSYTVLDGYPALGLAVGPRMTLHLTKPAQQDWDPENPFARAVSKIMHRVMGQAEQHPNPKEDWGSFDTKLEREVYGWGLGSSAAFTTALCSAIAHSRGHHDPMKLFEYARASHRMGQGGKGSGVDIAACSFGGLVYVSHAQDDTLPFCRPFSWPAHLGILLLRSGKKADTREKITSYRDIDSSTKQKANRPVLRAIGGVCRAFLKGEGILAAIRENARCEALWSQQLQIPLVTPQQRKLEEHLYKSFPEHDIVIKALGAGGGDSIACFYDKRHTNPDDVSPIFTDFGLESRALNIETQGAKRLEHP